MVLCLDFEDSIKKITLGGVWKQEISIDFDILFANLEYNIFTKKRGVLIT